MLRETQLKQVSIGIVAKDILEDDVYVDVTPIELHIGTDGELTAKQVLKHSVTDANGNIENVQTDKIKTVKAKWLPYGDTNRLEPPTVCKNETVMLYRYADVDEWYWETLYNQLEYRKLEKRTIVISNKKSIDVPLDQLLKHSYYVTIDSINKLLHLHTSTTDGEYTEYDIAIDTREGQLEITDAKGNRIFLDSQLDKWVIDSNEDVEANTKRTTNNSSVSITENTPDSTENVDNHKQINCSTFSVNNGDELIGILSELVQACHDAVGEGNLGFPVPMDGATQSNFDAIKARLLTYKP